nr:signal peptide peptidase SppA [Ameyamaea chiangmaiensis]
MARLQQRRALLRWRLGAIGAFTLLVAVAGGVRLHVSDHGGLKRDHLARLRVTGVIGSDVSRLTDALRDAGDDASVKAIILDVDTPGGSVTGGENLHDAVERAARRKPVVVTMDGLAASAGYMISVPAQRIFAQRATLTGSIGVLMQAPDFSGLLGKVGVSVDQLVSGDLKGQPSGVQPLSPAGRAMLQSLVGELYEQFVAMVAAGRHMSPDAVRALADGRPYTGAKAVTLGLVDQIGTEDDARNWLRDRYHISLALPVRDIGQKKRNWLVAHMASGDFGGLAQAIVSKGFLGQDLARGGPVALLQLGD